MDWGCVMAALPCAAALLAPAAARAALQACTSPTPALQQLTPPSVHQGHHPEQSRLRG